MAPGPDAARATGSGRWWVVAALALSCVAIGIDGTVLSLALPTLATELHASTAQLQWIVNAYLLALGAAMLPAGLLGDRYGRKRLLTGALLLFAAGSAACAYAGSSGQLIAARALLGVAAACIMPLALSILPVVFAEHERQRALAAVASSAIVAYPLGPIVGGWLLTHYWWGAVFLINIPVIAIAVPVVSLLLPESRAERRPDLDPAGMAASTAGLTALTFGLIEAGQRGWDDALALSWMAAGAVLLAGFVGWQRRLTRRGTRQPMVDLGLFRSRAFAWGTLLATMVSFTMIGLLFAVPQYLRAVLDLDSMGAGIRLLPMIGGMFLGLAAGDRIASRAGAAVTSAIGFAVAAAGLGLGALTGMGDGTGHLAVWIAVMGAGTGLVIPSTMNAALSQLTGERSGVGSALISAVRQIGGTFGVAVLGSLLNTAYTGRLDLTGVPARAAVAIRDGVASGVVAAQQLGSAGLLGSVRSAFVHGMDVLLATSAGIAAVSAVLALAFLPGRRITPHAGAVHHAPRIRDSRRRRPTAAHPTGRYTPA